MVRTCLEAGVQFAPERHHALAHRRQTIAGIASQAVDGRAQHHAGRLRLCALPGQRLLRENAQPLALSPRRAALEGRKKEQQQRGYESGGRREGQKGGRLSEEALEAH